jgi:fatty acid desaturase
VQLVIDDIALYAGQRTRLTNSAGQRLVDFVRGLAPRYGIVYRDITFGYVCLILFCALTALAPSAGLSWLAAGVIGALPIGYCIAYLQLFIHEGAHFNLAADKRRSDLLCDLLISWMAGTSVANYRIVHFRHHRELGTTDDSEHTYFYPLNLMFIVKSLTGWRALEVLAFRKRMQPSVAAKKNFSLPWHALIGAGAHVAIILTSFYVGLWSLALAWSLAVILVFPFFGAMRQLLEHRKGDAQGDIDYFKQSHGAYSRLFGDNPIDATFGGAGFNRHLLHHWEPQVSYTNLKELEAFLCDTPLRSRIDERRTSYASAFVSLLHPW